MTKYYHAENCNRKFNNGVEFQPYSLAGGTWNGVFATEDQAQQDYLGALAGNPTTAVREIQEDEYNRAVASVSGVKNYSPSPEPFKPKPVKAQAVRVAEKAGVVVQEPAPKPEEPPPVTAKPLENVNEALQVDKVEKAGDETLKAPAPKKQPQTPKAT